MMIDESWNERGPAADTAAPMPEVTDRATWQAQLDEVLVREKAHTREGDAIAAARRRLPMVEVDPSIPVTGEHGQVPLVEVFEGRRQLIAYYRMWHTGKPAQDQCPGCTFCNGQVSDLSYLHSRDVTFATFSEGPYEESARYREFMGYPMPWYSAMGSVYGLLDMTVYGRQETFEDSPPGWPQFWRNTGEQWRINGRPTPQWERLAGGHFDDAGVSAF
jgi:Bacterial protein of unknown function (DUF899)